MSRPIPYPLFCFVLTTITVVGIGSLCFGQADQGRPVREEGAAASSRLGLDDATPGPALRQPGGAGERRGVLTELAQQRGTQIMS